MQASGPSLRGNASTSGRLVVFKSWADDLVENDTNGTLDVFVHDVRLGATRRVSVSSSGVESNGFSSHPVISANGRLATFYSAGDNLVTGDTNQSWDVFVHALAGVD